MAKNQQVTKNFNTSASTSSKDRAVALHEEWQKCDSGIEKVRASWTDHEKMFFNKARGKLAEEAAKSNVNDGHLSTAIIQRTQRIMAQPPTGNAQSLDRSDKGKSMLINILLDRYIKPNANAQYPHLTKLKLWTIYSQIYGSMPALVDYRVTDHYTGPDFWLIPIRQYYPQPGINQINDMDYCFIDSFVSGAWLASRDKATWKNIDLLLQKVKEKEGKSKSQYTQQSYPEQQWGNIEYGGKGKFAQVLIRTKYTRDKWQVYAPDFPDVGIIREITNPHKNDKLPIIVKETIPLLDRPTGLGDIERGTPLQKTINSLLNLGMDTAKFTLFPPMVVNRNGVVPQSMKWEPMAFWNETIPNSIRQLQLSPLGNDTFNNMQGFLVSTLNNMLGTTDLSVSRNVDANMGKTPQALKMQAIKESAADSWERQSLEDALQELYDRFIDLMANTTEKPIDLSLVEGELDQIQQLYPDVTEMFESRRYGKITIKPEMIKGQYKFFIDSGSTLAKDQTIENEALTNILMTVLKAPVVLQAMQEKGKTIDMGELVKRWIITSGIQGADKIIVDATPPQQMMGQETPQGPQMQEFDMSQLQDPEIREVAAQLFGGNQPPPMGQPQELQPPMSPQSMGGPMNGAI